MKVIKLTESKNNKINESSSCPARDRLTSMLDDGVINAHTLASELIAWLSEEDVAEFANAYDYFPEEDE